MFNIILLILALANSAFAATAWMYDDINCPSNELNSNGFGVRSLSADPQISDFPTTHQQQYFWSVMVTDIDQDEGYSIMSDDDNGQCNIIFVQLGILCLQTNYDDIFGASWFIPTQRALVALPATCKTVQHADVYYIALPGEQRKPYSITVAKQFDQAGAVNWSINSFNADKLDVVQEIIAQHANDLDQV
ncbi:hypothetical protein PILCRDRAFT_85528 [Piloderma croceum F 1598]|uniref:Uncharacterized protein n=1 Tax=Piloderma croceum (strain F 1598) TaxID=765440 RepID=A0A0C3BPA7_PILCF|nr:hypothetical protein PILCRDRAFT_85528 [Piloderma croceum F 1598]